MTASLNVDLHGESGERQVTGVDRSLDQKIVTVAFGSRASRRIFECGRSIAILSKSLADLRE